LSRKEVTLKHRQISPVEQWPLLHPHQILAFKAPSAILKGEFGLVAEVDFTPAYSGKHDNSILGVYNGDYEVAAIANSVSYSG
jgi:hypothetical protein